MELDTETDAPHSPRNTLEYCRSEVRRHDPERFFATLFAPVPARDHILSLYAFEGELRRIRASVSNPLLGEIRLQWWADAIAGLYAGTVRDQPVVRALAEAVRVNRIPRDRLAAIAEGYFDDIVADDHRAAPDIARFARATTGAVSRLAAGILDGNPKTLDRAETAGTAWGLTEFVRSVPHRNDVSGALQAAVPALCDLARQDVAAIRSCFGQLSRTCLPVFLTATLASRHLMRFQAGGYRAEALVSDISTPRMLLTLYGAALRYRLRNRGD